jgi:hypothetical protein
MDGVLELGVSTASSSAAEFARKLISQGKVSSSQTWDGPSAESENAYLNTNGWEKFGQWYLGRNESNPKDTKGRYTFPFTDDFKTVSINGLRAIRQRAGQQDDTGIFNAAGPLFSQAREKVEAHSEKIFTFGYGSGVDFEQGILNDVTLVEVGEARGHGILVTEQTLRDGIKKMAGKSLPAYITHANAQGDRLTSEVGFFSGFYLDGGCEHAPYHPDWCKDKRRTRLPPAHGDTTSKDHPRKGHGHYPTTYPNPQARKDARRKRRRERGGGNIGISPGQRGRGFQPMSIKARRFTAFESFKKYQPETYERLFEMAETLPDSFGISLVFEAALAWEMPDGTEPYISMEEKPEGTLYEWPTVEMTSVQSADFVDNPAATSSLFSEPNQNQNQKTMSTPELVELTTAASDELERRRAAEEAGEGKEKSKPVAAKKKTKKKKLSEPEAETEVIAEPAEGEETSEGTQVLAQQEVIDDLEERLSTLASENKTIKAEVEKLRSFMEGGEVIEEDAAPESTEESVPTAQLKAKAVLQIMESNPSFSRSQALLEVGKAHPEFFTMNTKPIN